MDDDDQDLYPEVDADDDYDAFVTVKEREISCWLSAVRRFPGVLASFSCSVCLKGNFNGMLRLSAAPMSSMKLALMSCF